MTIDGLPKFVSDKVPANKVSLNLFRGKKIAIDMANFVYVMWTGASRSYIRNNFGQIVANPESTISAAEINIQACKMICNRLSLYMEYDITPICVFDSASHSLRAIVKEKRNTKKNNSREKMSKLIETLKAMTPMQRFSKIDEYITYYNSSVNLYEHITEVKMFLSSCGWCVLTPDMFYPARADGTPLNGDGEALCATLCINGICHGSITKDYDFFVYGGTIAISVDTENVYHDTIVSIRYLTDILAQCDFGESTTDELFGKFQDACMLAGTDYNLKNSGVSFITACKLIKKYESFDKIPDTVIDKGVVNYDEVKEIFHITSININVPNAIFDVNKFYSVGINLMNERGYNIASNNIVRSPLVYAKQVVTTPTGFCIQ